ncbi:MAG: hypothetical protein AB7F86_16790 [Bdellovibrionales bacterium]
MKNLILILVPLILTACTTVEKSIALGAAVGGTAGGAIGNKDGTYNRDKATVQGVAIGAILGGLIGYAAHKDKSKTQNTPIEKVGLEPKAPSLTAPRVRRVFVPARIEGDKYIDGHYEYVIEKATGWSL